MPLVAAGELSDDTLLTIETTVANDVNIGEAIESDIIYGVSVETNLIELKRTTVLKNETFLRRKKQVLINKLFMNCGVKSGGRFVTCKWEFRTR